MTIPQFQDATKYVREKAHKFALKNKKRKRIKFPFEKKMDDIEFWWHRFEDRYLTNDEYRAKIDARIFLCVSAILALIVGVCAAMIYGVLTYPY